jgi:mRNA-degrading endonuclease toxin of MazEF toxin-antitoxin module
LNTNISIYKQQQIQIQQPDNTNTIIQDINDLYKSHSIKLETISPINAIEQNSLALISIPNAIGLEKGGKRYALIISNTHFNNHSGLVTVITSTNPKTKTNNKNNLNTSILIPSNSVEGFSSDTLLQCECITTINKAQIIKVYGKLSHELLLKVKTGIENHIPLLK